VQWRGRWWARSGWSGARIGFLDLAPLCLGDEVAAFRAGLSDFGYRGQKYRN
jgi:hypothetical protein